MWRGIQYLIGAGRALKWPWRSAVRELPVLALGVLFFFPGIVAHADGFMIGKGGEIREPEQKAVILFTGGVEDLIIQVQYDGAVDEFAWLVPVPARPEVSVVNADVFGELARYAYERRRRNVYMRRYSGFRSIGGIGGDTVTVHERRTVGVYDVAILSSETVDGLVRWCTQSGFQVPDEAPSVLKHYVDQGWVFTAMRIDPAALGKESEGALRAGTIQAMRFTFPAKEAIYPLRISSINRGATDVLVYVLAEDTLVNPLFVQRHAPQLDEFRLHRIEVAADGVRDLEKEFEARYDVPRWCYRPVAPNELPALHRALPRWGRAPLYLTPLQKTFEPEELVDDVIFKVPETMGLEAQKAFVDAQIDHIAVDPVVLRIPHAAALAIEERLARYELEKGKVPTHIGHVMDVVALLDENYAAAAITRAAEHDDAYIRKELTRELGRAWFGEDRTRYPYDTITEKPLCEQSHSGYGLTESNWYCHGREVVLPGAPTDTLVVALESIFYSEDANAEIARRLAAIGTEQAVSVLTRAVFGELEGQSGAGIRYRRELAFAALRHLRDPAMVGIYRRVIATSLDALSEREITCCLVGLWNNATPEIDMLVRQIELHCQRERMPVGAALARRLLVNRLGTRTPLIEEGMSLAEIEEELGGKGMIAKQLVAAGEEVVQYHWGAGDATVRSGIVVKWRPRKAG